MKNWNDYKDYVKKDDPLHAKDLTDAEEQAKIISTIIKQRNDLGLSQRDLASLCGMPQSSVARIESMKTTPTLATLLKLLRSLSLRLIVTK